MKIGIIGAGNMGGSIAAGLAKVGKEADLVLCDVNDKTLASYKAQYPGMTVSTDNEAAVDGTDVIIVVVKPWLIDVVMNPLVEKIDFKRQILISGVAGVPLDHLASYAGADAEQAALFRMIPNLAIAYGESMTFLAQRGASAEQVAAVSELFGQVGDVMMIEERQMGACTALSSCGIAYVMRYIRAATEGGVELGLYPDQASRIMLQTMAGAVALLKATGHHPEVYIDIMHGAGLIFWPIALFFVYGFTNAVIAGIKASNK